MSSPVFLSPERGAHPFKKTCLNPFFRRSHLNLGYMGSGNTLKLVSSHQLSWEIRVCGVTRRAKLCLCPPAKGVGEGRNLTSMTPKRKPKQQMLKPPYQPFTSLDDTISPVEAGLKMPSSAVGRADIRHWG